MTIREEGYAEGYRDGYSKRDVEIVRCKDCGNRECEGRAGTIVCGIDGTPHRPDWFCADGGRKDGDGDADDDILCHASFI